MKAIILFSSIFYLLGLKIGHKIDLFKNYNPVEKITTTTNAVKQVRKTVYFKDEVKLKCDKDSLKNESLDNKTIEKKTHL